MAQPQWTTPAGSLGKIAEGIFYSIELSAVDSDGGTVTYELVAGSLPSGIQVKTDGMLEGIPNTSVDVQGVPSEVSNDVTSNFAIRAKVTENGTTRINDRTFALTVTGQDIPEFSTPAGSIGTFFDGDQVSYQFQSVDSDPNDTLVYSLEFGQLPEGISLTSTGQLTGYIVPQDPLPPGVTIGFDGSLFDQFVFDFETRSIDKNYEFTLKISDGKDYNLRTFTMFVVSRDNLSADNEIITADEQGVTGDQMPFRPPFITNYPTNGNIGTFRHNNFFAYQFEYIDLDGDAVEFEIASGDSSDIPPNLIFDRYSGWLYGYLIDQGATEREWNFTISVGKLGQTYITSQEYDYTITIIGDISSEITWVTDSDLGFIENGATSLLKIEAISASGKSLNYRLKPGSYPATPGQYNKLPQGLTLLSTGDISGRVSFNGFTLDGGTTTFDSQRSTRLNVDPTTFDLKFTFTVNAYSNDGLIDVNKTFSVQVSRDYISPYESLYIEAMPPQEDRDFIDSLLLNSDILEPNSLFRPADPYFGAARDVKYIHAFSLDTASLDEYVTAMAQNHFRKRLVLGEIKTARALDNSGNILYEVIYSEVVDTGLNQQGQSPPLSVKTAFPVTLPDGSTITQVNPNSLVNMRNRVIDTVGQQDVVLPLWMTSNQADGRVLGFTRAWVICYTKPGESDRIAYNIRTQIGEVLNQIDFLVDRYILDQQLTKNWVVNEDSTDGGSWLPAAGTSFDTADEYSASVTNGGSGYAVNDSLKIVGSNLGGAEPVNDLTITVTAIYGTDVITVDVSDSTEPFAVNDQVEGILDDGSVTQGVITAISANGSQITIERVEYSTPFSGAIRKLFDPDVTKEIHSTTTTAGIIKSFELAGTASYAAEGNSYAGLTPVNIIGSGADSTFTVKVAGATTFDGDSVRFNTPVDMYEYTDQYNKYLLFPKTNILQ